MKTRNFILLFGILLSLFSCSNETEFTITLKESGYLQTQLLQNDIPIVGETVYLIPSTSVGKSELKSSLVQYSIDYKKTDANGNVDFGEVNAGNYYVAVDGIEISGKTYYPVKILQVISGSSKSVSMDALDFIGTIDLTVRSYDYYNNTYTPVSGSKLAIVKEEDVYYSNDINEALENAIEEKTTNSEGKVSFTLPSGVGYFAIVYTKNEFGEIINSDIEFLTYLDQDEEYEETIYIYSY